MLIFYISFRLKNDVRKKEDSDQNVNITIEKRS